MTRNPLWGRGVRMRSMRAYVEGLGGPVPVGHLVDWACKHFDCATRTAEGYVQVMVAAGSLRQDGDEVTVP